MEKSADNFNRLLGVWKTSGQISKEEELTHLAGIDTYELILDGKYILHKANVTMGSDKSETLEIITVDKTTGKASMQYFNSKGESGIMTGEISGDDFRIDGEGIKFSGMINDESSEITGKWFLQTDNSQWVEFINLKLEKQS